MISYKTHVENQGWGDYVSDGKLSGTTGQSLRVEALQIKIDAPGYDLGVKYQTHVQDIGWMDEVSDDEVAGTTGQSKRLEAVKINLTGKDADKFSVWYSNHVQGVGNMNWSRDGEPNGTEGYDLRSEGIRILVLPKAVDLRADQSDGFKHYVIPVAVPVVEEITPTTVMASEHFAMNEYACDCVPEKENFGWCNGFPVEMDAGLLAMIEQLRVLIGIPIYISSGVRCEECNSYWGGVPDSQHKDGTAADLIVEGMTVDELADAARSVGLGIIKYPYSGFVHVQSVDTDRYTVGE